MRHSKKKPIDVGLGLESLDEIFKGLSSFIELASNMEKEGQDKVERSGEIKIPGGNKAMYGFSVKIGGTGIPKMEHFGNIVSETEQGPVVEEVREPFVDIFEESDSLEVIVELPGVEEGDISFEIKDDVLILNANGEDRKYSTEILLPCKASHLKTVYKNGILNLTMKKEEI